MSWSDESSYWNEEHDPLGIHKQQPLPVMPTEYKAVEVHPGILYVAEMETGLYKKYLAKDPIVPLPHDSKLVATFDAHFPDATSSVADIPVDEL